MKINKEIIAKLKPCKSRFDNYLKHYSNFDSDLSEFIKLEDITYDDKVWVFVRLASKEQSVKWAALCAKSVLHIFEEKYPNDKRPRNAIDAILNNTLTLEIRKNALVAVAAAIAAADAAYNAANAANAAANAAAYAAADAAVATARAADAAADAAANTATNKQLQQNVNLNLMLEVIK